MGAERATFIDSICDDHLLVRVPSPPLRYLFVCSSETQASSPCQTEEALGKRLRNENILGLFFNELVTHFIAENELVC